MQKLVSCPIENELIAFNEAYQSHLQSENIYFNNILSNLKVHQGKLIRPKFVLLSAAISGKINPFTYQVASIIELLHLSSLIHDDVIDNSLIRRNKQTVNAAFGNKTAVLVGDYLLLKCLRLINQINNADLIDYLIRIFETMLQGELNQLQSINCFDMNEDQYFEVVKAKTGNLIRACFELGALSAKASESTVKWFREMGEEIGIAFQMKDDLKDLNSDISDKEHAKDIKEHVVTLPVIYSIQKMKESEKQNFIQLYKNHNNDPLKIEEIIKQINHFGGIEQTRKLIDKKIEKAKQIISLQNDNIYGSFLIQLIENIKLF